MCGAGGGSLVLLGLAVPPFDFKRHLGAIVVVERDNWSQEEHGGADDEPAPGRIAGMGFEP